MQEDKLNSVKDRIKSRRVELGLSYQELSERTGISKSTLQRYETGYIKNVPLDSLWILAEALETTPNWILCLNTADDLPKKQYDIFIENMTFLMKTRNITYKDISQKTELPQSLLKKINNKTIFVSQNTLKLIAKALDLEISDMLYTKLEISSWEKMSKYARKLNQKGLEKVINYMEDLLLSDKYMA